MQRRKDETKARLAKLIKGTGDETYDRLTRLMILGALETWCGRALNTCESEYTNQLIGFHLMRDLANHIQETAVL